jgi:hypothetical protein
VNGMNCAVMAFGASASGKTHTLEGTGPDGEGGVVIPSLHALYDELFTKSKKVAERGNQVRKAHEAYDFSVESWCQPARPEAIAGSRLLSPTGLLPRCARAFPRAGSCNCTASAARTYTQTMTTLRWRCRRRRRTAGTCAARACAPLRTPLLWWRISTRDVLGAARAPPRNVPLRSSPFRYIARTWKDWSGTVHAPLLIWRVHTTSLHLQCQPAQANISAHTAASLGVRFQRGLLWQICAFPPTGSSPAFRLSVGATALPYLLTGLSVIPQVLQFVPGGLDEDAAEMDEASVLVSHLTFVDCPGAEKLLTDAEVLRLREGAAMNRPILALGNVVRALSNAATVELANYSTPRLTPQLCAFLPLVSLLAGDGPRLKTRGSRAPLWRRTTLCSRQLIDLSPNQSGPVRTCSRVAELARRIVRQMARS